MIDKTTLITRLSFLSSVEGCGLLVGSGLPIALTKNKAPNWVQLLQRVAARNSVDLTKIAEAGVGCPDIATGLAAKMEEGEDFLKLEVSREIESMQTDADPVAMKALSEGLSTFRPPFVVTTNYDTLIEEAWPEGVCILPSDRDTTASDRVPVYHMHGACAEPDSLILTSLDYARTHRPTDYRGYRLPYFFAESFLLVVGYKLSDTNMLAALQVATSFDPPGAAADSLLEGKRVVVLSFSKTPEPAPYEHHTGAALVLETDDVVGFLKDVGTRAEKLRAAYNKPDFDTKLTELFDRNSLSLPLAVENLAIEQLQALHADTDTPGAFEAYTPWLRFALMQLAKKQLCARHPRLLHALCESLDRNARYLDADGSKGSSVGIAWEASKVLRDPNGPLCTDTTLRDRVARYADTRGLKGLKALLADLL